MVGLQGIDVDSVLVEECPTYRMGWAYSLLDKIIVGEKKTKGEYLNTFRAVGEIFGLSIEIF